MMLAVLRALNDAQARDFVPLWIANDHVGSIRRDNAPLLRDFGVPLRKHPRGWALEGSCDALSQRLAECTRRMAAAGVIRGWRGELNALRAAFDAPIRARIERAAMPWFGGTGYGVHLNGFCMRDGQRYLWLARRALHKATAPGKLDQLVAGGIPCGLGVFANLEKESAEEAGLRPEMVAQARAVGALSYHQAWGRGLRADVAFVYDLELAPDFVPHNVDGEVAEFLCWPVAQVRAALQDQPELFKANSALVLIDAFIRWGILTPEDRDYTELCALRNTRGEFLRLQMP